MQALREIGFRVYGIGKPQPQTDAETTSAEATARGRKRCPRPAVLAQRADAYCAAAATVWRLRLLCLLCLLGRRLLRLLGRRLPARRLLLCGGGWAGIWAAPPSSATRLLAHLGGNSSPG